MGCYDSVIVRCECGGSVEFQSKAGDCSLKQYYPDEVPPEIAADIMGDVEFCEDCGCSVTMGETKVKSVDIRNLIVRG